MLDDDPDAALLLLRQHSLHDLRHVLDIQWFLEYNLLAVVLRSHCIEFVEQLERFELEVVPKTLAD